jgi:hypothetical protein
MKQKINEALVELIEISNQNGVALETVVSLHNAIIQKEAISTLGLYGAIGNIFPSVASFAKSKMAGTDGEEEE